MVLAMGLVFVLLLGEIDLSAGFAAGMGAAILAITLTDPRLGVAAGVARGAGDRRRRSASRSLCWSRGSGSRASS